MTSLCTIASSSPARPSAREIASFMNETCRRTACPSEAADCSARRSGSARRMATSVIVDDLRRSSSARQASSATTHITPIGHDDGGEGEEGGGARQQVEPAHDRSARAERQQRKDAVPMARPDDAGDGGILEDGVRRLLLQRENQAADARAVVVGGDAVARGTGGAAPRHAPARGLDLALGFGTRLDLERIETSTAWEQERLRRMSSPSSPPDSRGGSGGRGLLGRRPWRSS